MSSSAFRYAVPLLVVVEFHTATAEYDVVWNAPTAGCEGECRRAPDPESFDILVNPDQSFNGSVITLFYDSFEWPMLDCEGIYPNFTSITVKQNGGVPQLGEIQAHLDSLATVIQNKIPDPEFNGLAIFDEESWRPLYELNWDSLSCYQQYSQSLIRNAHPQWKDEWVESAAKFAFDASARVFWEQTLILAKSLRPGARWGFYGHPMQSDTSSAVATYSDELQWLWNELGVFTPSRYLRSASPFEISVADQVASVVHTIEESQRLAAVADWANRDDPSYRRPLVMPYVSLYYRDSERSGFLGYSDLAATIRAPGAAGADGVVLWGGSADTADCDGCQALADFLDDEAGALVDSCVEYRRLCDELRCHGNGKCADDFDFDYPEFSCRDYFAHDDDNASSSCICDLGWEGTRCWKASVVVVPEGG